MFIPRAFRELRISELIIRSQRLRINVNNDRIFRRHRSGSIFLAAISFLPSSLIVEKFPFALITLEMIYRLETYATANAERVH